MKINQIHDTVHVDGGDTQKFGLEFNSKIVHMLSNTLYSNKILAIMRELSTNAYDSHIEAKNTEPFDVHLPTSINSVFYIRDYGTGMSPEKMKGIYSVYGKSDKSDSNEYIGCLGLGSKSPFCYHTKTFMVESFYEGNKYTYTCYLDSTGMPSYTEMDVTSTSEKNGVKVTIQVDRKDIYNFSSNIGVYSYFKIKPNILGNKLSIPVTTYLEENSLYGIRQSGSAKIIMGNIAYPLSDISSLTEEERKLLNFPIDLFFNIGQLDVNISRESLSYDDLTINRIKIRLQHVINTFKSEINKVLSAAPSLYDARSEVIKLNSKKLEFINESTLTWNGKKIWINNRRIDLDTDVMCYSPNRTRGKTRQFFIFYPNYKFLRFDLKTGNFVRIQQYLKNNRVEIIEINDHNVELIKEKFGILDSHIENVSALPYSIVRKPRQARSLSTRVMVWKGFNMFKTYSWISIEKDLKEGGYYVPWKNYEAIIPGNNRALHNIVTIIGQLGLQIGVVYGIKEKHVAKLNPNWVNLYTYVQDYVKKTIDKDKIVEQAEKKYIYHTLASDYKTSFLVDFIDILPELKDIKDFKNLPDVEPQFNLIKVFEKINFTTPQHENLKKILLKKYPLLHALCDYDGDETVLRKEIKSILKEKLCLQEE